MTQLSYHRHFQFHGLNIAVFSGQEAVLDALGARFRYFDQGDRNAPDFIFEFHFLAADEAHCFEKPDGTSHVVDMSDISEVLYFHQVDQLYIDYMGQARVLCDLTCGQVRVSIQPIQQDNLWLISHPLFTFPFVELLKRRKHYIVHAAGLTFNGRGLLVAGVSGSGKSTLTLTLLRGGYGFMGDDMVFLQNTQSGLQMFAFPDEIDVTDQTATFFPELSDLLHQPKTPGWHKRQVLAEELYDVDYVPQSQPVAMIFPRVANREHSVLKPIEPGEALLQLIPDLLRTDQNSSQKHFDVLGQLVRECACYRLETGRDFERLPEMLSEIIA